MYYNTNDESGSTLKASRIKTDNQNVLVLGVFKAFPEENLMPEEVSDYIERTFEKTYPITSIRRAITDLTSEGKIKKTDVRKLGKWGKRVHTWKLENK